MLLSLETHAGLKKKKRRNTQQHMQFEFNFSFGQSTLFLLNCLHLVYRSVSVFCLCKRRRLAFNASLRMSPHTTAPRHFQNYSDTFTNTEKYVWHHKMFSICFRTDLLLWHLHNWQAEKCGNIIPGKFTVVSLSSWVDSGIVCFSGAQLKQIGTDDGVCISGSLVQPGCGLETQNQDRTDGWQRQKRRIPAPKSIIKRQVQSVWGHANFNTFAGLPWLHSEFNVKTCFCRLK